MSDLGADLELPREAFAQWINSRLPHYGSIDDFAIACAAPEKKLREIRNGWKSEKGGRKPITHVALSFVDRCLVREGTTLLLEVYPHLYEGVDLELMTLR